MSPSELARLDGTDPELYARGEKNLRQARRLVNGNRLTRQAHAALSQVPVRCDDGVAADRPARESKLRGTWTDQIHSHVTIQTGKGRRQNPKELKVVQTALSSTARLDGPGPSAGSGDP
ncbi:MAG: hypothetical protein AAF526_10660 [Pseudomonadota bacterium]